jgi:hypothetical protein
MGRTPKTLSSTSWSICRHRRCRQPRRSQRSHSRHGTVATYSMNWPLGKKFLFSFLRFCKIKCNVSNAML